ncbi:MAG: VWA domain-containing protein [Anaerolineae bacterium]
MNFVYQTVLVLLGLIPAFLALFVWRSRRRRALLGRIGDTGLVQQLAGTTNSVIRHWKSGLWLAALAALIVALARPVWGIDEDFVEARGVAIMVVLDVSASMDAQDVLPSRLDRAKLAARRLYEESQGDQVGLILFAGDAFVQFPLTSDTISAVTFLNAASTGSISRQGTAIEDALRLAVGAMDERIASNSIIVLMTDGENHEGLPLLAAEEAAERGITVHVIGFGTEEGEPIPERNTSGDVTGYKTDNAGNLVYTRLEQETLQQIAEIAGGTYQQASDSGIEVVNLLNEITEVQAEVLERRRETRPIERFTLFVGLALLALSLEMILPEARSST